MSLENFKKFIHDRYNDLDLDDLITVIEPSRSKKNKLVSVTSTKDDPVNDENKDVSNEKVGAGPESLPLIPQIDVTKFATVEMLSGIEAKVNALLADNSLSDKIVTSLNRIDMLEKKVNQIVVDMNRIYKMVLSINAYVDREISLKNNIKTFASTFK